MSFFSEKIVYLTFDDGPDPENTPRILEILTRYGIKATFFVIGTNVEKYPEILQQIDQQGSVVGNHTYSHKYEILYSSEEAFLEEIKRNEELICKLIEKRPLVVREPGGKFLGNPESKLFLTQAGYQVYEWNVDSYDSRQPVPSAAEILNNVIGQSQKKALGDKLIILFHDSKGHESTVEALPAIIEYLSKQGFVFKVLE